MKKILITLLLILPGICFSQVTPNWAATYSGPGNFDDQVNAMATDISGNVYVTGSSVGSGSMEDYATIKYNASGVRLWTARYNGPANSYDIALGIAVDDSGNVFVTGYSDGGGTNSDIATIKYNSLGVQEWIIRYNSNINGFDGGKAIAVDHSGNVFVTGYLSTASTGMDIITFKYNTNGGQQFVSLFDGAAHSLDEPVALALDNSGNIYVGGNCYNNNLYTDYVVIKYNSNGVPQWSAGYNGPNGKTDVMTDLKIDASGNVYATGFSDGGASFDDYATVKFNSAGVQQWAARYNDPFNNYDKANSLAVDNAGNVYVTGNAYINRPNIFDIATIKYNSAGVQQWLAVYSDSVNVSAEGRSVTVDNAGYILVTGKAYRLNGYSCVLIKYDPLSVQQWTGFYPSSGGFAWGNVVKTDTARNVFVGGVWGGSDFMTLKFSDQPLNQPVLFQPVNDTVVYQPVFVRYKWFKLPGSEHYTMQISTDSLFTNMIYNDSTLTDSLHVQVYPVAGTTYWWRIRGKNFFGTGPWSEVWKFTDNPPIGISPVSSEIPKEFSLYNSYPNPFNPATKIKFDIPQVRGSDLVPVKIAVYDILGREVKILLNEPLQPGKYEIEWNASNFPSGIYFYSITAADFKNTKKMALIK